MSGNANFPTSLDDDTSLLDVTDGVSTLLASHHNNTKEALKRLEAKVGIFNTLAPTSLDYRLGSATDSHRHDGASGQANRINATAITIPSGGFPSGFSLHEHLMSATLHTASPVAGTGIASMIGNNVIFAPSAARVLATGIASVVSQSGATILVFVPTTVPDYFGQLFRAGSMVATVNFFNPVSFPKTMRMVALRGNLRVGPSGATTGLTVRVGPTNVFAASVGFSPAFAPGATNYGQPSCNLVTYPSGAVITVDVDAVGSNDPGQDGSITFLFRE